MKRILCVILVFWISCYAFGQITQTLILDSTALTNLRTSLGLADSFLAQSMSSTYGPYRTDDNDLRDYGILTSVTTMANNLQSALFGTNQSIVVANINTSLNNLNFDYNDFRDYYLSHISTHNGVTDTTEAWARSLHLCYLTERASSIFDAFYSSADSTNLNKLRTIISSCVDMIDYIKAKYDSLSVPFNRYYWGVAKDSYPDFVENGNDIYLPSFSTVQLKLLFCTAWGYGALVLKKDAQIRGDATTENKMNQYLSVIDSMLTTIHYPQFADFQRQGLLAFHTNNSGGYIESLGYLDMVMTMSSPFFTTYVRMGGINYYNNNYIMGWIEDAINKTTPYLGDWAYNDTNYRGYGNVSYGSTAGPKLNTIINGVAEFFYNNTNNAALRNKCTGYVHSRRVNGYYPGIIFLGSYNNYLMLYNSNPTRNLGTATDYPDGMKNGTWSNSEFTVLKKNPSVTATLSEELVNNPSMYITHKNSMNCDHNQADQTSYSFFYRGKQFLLDPGYRNVYYNWKYTRVWMKSPYAHNMVIVNPLDQIELGEIEAGYINCEDYYYDGLYFKSHGTDSLKSYRPSCRMESAVPTTAAEMFKSPSYRTYISQNTEMDILQTFLRYDYNFLDNNPFQTDLIRTYIRDGNLFFVYDDLISPPATDMIYWNLLQMGFSNDSNGLSSIVDSRFSLTKGSTSSSSSYVASIDCVDFASGSNLLFSNTIDNVNNVVGGVPYRLPMDNLILEYKGGDSSAGGADNQPHPGIDHKRIRTVVNGLNPKFLTVIAPRESYDDDQLITQTIHSPVNDPNKLYGVRIKSKSHSNNAILCNTFSGCSDGNGISATFPMDAFNSTGALIQTNAKYFLITKPNNTGTTPEIDNSLVLLDGIVLTVNHLDIYRCFTTDVKNISASYLNNTLHVEFNSSRAVCPMFKISRGGVMPEQFTASLSYTLDPNITAQIPRYNISDVINTLAYDNDYFYVNYNLNDLVMDGLLTENLFVYKGNYVCPPNWTTLQFYGPEITLEGEWFIPDGNRLSIMGNNTVRVSPDFSLAVDGIFEMQGANENGLCQLTEDDTTAYMQIEINSGGHIVLANSKIENASVLQVRGSIECQNFYMNHCEAGMMLLSNRDINLDGVCITNCNGYGMVMQNIWPDGYNGGFHNITLSHNKYGLFLYNSSPILEAMFISDNDYYGLICMRNSNPFVKDSSINNTYIHSQLFNNERPEITLYEDCLPCLIQNDIIFGDGYSLFSYDSNPPALSCPENYWGTLDDETIRQSIFPPEWEVNYMPILETSVIMNNTPNLITSYFINAVGFEKAGNFVTAAAMYKTIIENYPTSQEAPESASRLVCIAQNDIELQLAKDYLDGICIQYPSTHLADAAYLDSRQCERLLEEYSEAIAGYQDRLDENISYMDSLLTQLDIIYTYLESVANGTKAITQAVMCMGEPLVSSKRAKELEVLILDEILNQPYPGAELTHVPDIITTMNNYPNPFNPTTTITFSTPKTSKCELIVYNIKGQAVKHLLSGTKNRGIYKAVWNSNDDNGKRVSSGVYFYRLNIDGHITTRKMLLMK